MPKPKLVYEIDDALSVEDNLLTLGTAVDALDPALSAVLKSKLSEWAGNEAVDTDSILDALFEATALQEPAGEEAHA